MPPIANFEIVTGFSCLRSASEVLKAGHGICFAKSHLLAALLRCKSIPAGFCYQKLILDDEMAPVLIYHGLNGVYLKDSKKLRENKARTELWDDLPTELEYDMAKRYL